jgi:HlyD family secretion protein
MKLLSIRTLAAGLMLVTASCSKKEKTFDATGTFEAVETIISAEAAGKIETLSLEEGQALKAGQVLGYIDSTQLYLKKQQMEAQIRALLSKQPVVSVQLAALMEQLNTAEREQKRVERLVKADAATTKQLDDATANIEVIKKQIEALRSTLEISKSSIGKEAGPMMVQIDQLNDQLEKCRIVNPVNGTVLTKYAETNELTAPGKPLYKIADLSAITLRAYITGNQLPVVKLGQKVKVHTDNGSGGYNEAEGTITWISDKAEFTPKTIQTKDERANMVYATKVMVKNDGSYKIGMYGEIKFQ